jgi:methylmalonyl-CoA/ethylmalonyl-CoA epimerase
MSSTATPTTTPRLALRRVHQISITVQDLERAIGFYRDTLGLPLLFQAPPGLAFFDCGGVRLMLSRPEQGDEGHGTSIVYYSVDDIHEAHATLTSRGARFVEGPHVVARLADHDVWMAICRDSEDNFVGLMSEVRR